MRRGPARAAGAFVAVLMLPVLAVQAGASPSPTPTPIVALPTPTPPLPSSTPVPTPGGTPVPTPTLPPPSAPPTPSPSSSPSGSGASPTPAPSASTSEPPNSGPTGSPSASPSPTPCASASPGAPPAATPSPGASPDPCDRQRLIDEVRAQLGGALADALAAQAQLLASVQNSDKQQAELQARIDSSSRTIADLESRTAGLERRTADTEKKIAVDRAEAGALARALYRQPGSIVAYIASAHDLADMLLSVASLSAAGRRADHLESQLTSELQQLKDDRQRQRELRDQENAVRAHMTQDLIKMAALEDQQQASIAQVAGQIAAIRGELDRVGSQDPALAQRIANQLTTDQLTIISVAMRQVWMQILLYLDATGGSQGGSATGSLSMPIQGAVMTQPFGPSSLGLEPTYGGYPHFHTGLDLAAPAGTPVTAAAPGIVALVGDDHVGYGRYVVLAHDGGVTTLYGHLGQAVVNAGDRVDQGQPIGLEGSTGNSTGPHLHFEVRVNGVLVDPMPYLTGQGQASGATQP